MSRKAAKGREKAKILRWRGVLDDSARMLRWTVAVLLAVAGAALAFTQLGFVAITLPGETVAYVVVLLEVVALGALLLGTLSGAVLGFAIGGVLFAHSQFLPLDHYEQMFINPVTSIVMFGVCGLLLGVLFAFVLRNDPAQGKRVVYIPIVCLVVSWLYSFGFSANVFIALVMEIGTKVGVNASDAYVQQMAVQTAMQLGDGQVQTWSTALLMALLCVVGDFVARKALASKGSMGLRAVFGSWLGVVVALAFMLMSAVSFAVTTGDELHDAEDLMMGEIDYLDRQMELAVERSKLFGKIINQGELDFDKVEESTFWEFSNSIEDKSLLDGYTEEGDGIILVLIDDVVYGTNNERYKDGALLEDVLGADAIEAIERGKETETIQRFVSGSVTASLDDSADSIGLDISVGQGYQPELAYLCAKDISGNFVNTSEERQDYSQSIVMIQSSDQVFAKRSSVMMWMSLSSLVLLLAVFAIISQLLSRVVVRRIDETNGVLSRVTDGDLDARVEARDTREFESLSEGINTTVMALRGWIAEAETRMDAELNTARAIQEASLPRTFPPYPDILKFDIFASMNAAKQVGGDFYDYFLMGDDCDSASGKLGFVVADVSGKGVPAALFMMKAKALLRDYMASGMELGEAVEEANRQLVDGNDAGMFVTAWVGVLDYGTGHVDYVNAGHNPPLLWQHEGGWRWMREKSGPVLGLFEMPYRALSVDCKAGDTFLLYTDGVTEAFNVDEKLYGEERLLEVVEQGYLLHPRELLEAVRSDVASYAQGAEQSDDITILALEVGVPPEVTATLEVPAMVTQLDRVNEFLHAELNVRLCPQRVQTQLDVAVEELFVNVCHYAYPNATPDNPGSVRIQRTYSAEPASITVDIVDEGIPYNPLEKPDAVTPGNIEDVPIGGLGILMAKKSTDEMRYERVGKSNIVTIVKKW